MKHPGIFLLLNAIFLFLNPSSIFSQVEFGNRLYFHNTLAQADDGLLAMVGQGLGRAMLAELLAEADLKGCAVSLHVEPQNPVLRLYVRLGFEQVEERGAYLFMRRAASVAAVS